MHIKTAMKTKVYVNAFIDQKVHFNINVQQHAKIMLITCMLACGKNVVQFICAVTIISFISMQIKNKYILFTYTVQ